MNRPANLRIAIALGGLLVAGATLVEESCATDFLRGDVNQDGAVTQADAAYLGAWLFRQDLRPEDPGCWDAADADGDLAADISDVIRIVRTVLFDETLPPPFPEPGPGPEAGLGCETYDGSRSPLEAPDTRVVVRDIVIEGGGTGHGFLRVGLATSRSIAGYSGTILDASDVLVRDVDSRDDRERVTEFTGIPGTVGHVTVTSRGQSLHFAVLTSFLGSVAMPPTGDTDVLEFPVCVRPGTPAGEYPLTLETAELVDFDTTRPIAPELVSATIVVLEDVSEAECVPTPRTDVEFRLADGSAGRGETADLPLSVSANRGSQGIQFSLDFDETVLEVLSVESLVQRPDGGEFEVAMYDVYNEDRIPGSDEIEEGSVGGWFLISSPFLFVEPDVLLPVDEEFEFLNVRVRVKESARVGTTEIRFVDGTPIIPRPNPHGCTVLTRGGHCHRVEVYRNRLYSGQARVTPETANSFLFVNGFLEVVADVGFFRGDSNDDGDVDVSDAIFTLGYLFLGDNEPRCADASDTNDDGILDISDAVAVLQFLFLGSTLPPPSLEGCDADPTADSLPCALFASCR
ncbi:MAG: hypothetical protein O7J95_05035 [Planctomycetota bacterium]|nr:hypothetical protein [Planctomycetota bacterium]